MPDLPQRQKKTARGGGFRFLREPVFPPTPKPVSAWMCTYFCANNIAGLVSAARVDPKPPKFGEAARLLNEGFTLFAAHLAYGKPARPIDVETWASEVEGYARSLLFALGIDAQAAEPRLPDGVVRLLSDGLAAGGPKNTDVHAPHTDDWATNRRLVRRAPGFIKAVALAASGATRAASSKKKKGRRPDLARQALFLHTTQAYQEATGRAPKISRSANGGAAGGPCIRFHQAAFSLLRDRLTAENSEIQSDLFFSDEEIATAISDIRSIEK